MIFINQVAQGVRDLLDAESWFGTQATELKRAILEYIIMMAYQARFKDDEIQTAIHESGLRGTMTPCVLIQKTPTKVYLRKTINLPEGELWKSFKLLLELFRTADRRRRQSEQGECTRHWWHRDLGNPDVVSEIRRDYFGYSG